MARKFMFRGKTLEELQNMSMDEIAGMVKSRSRRKLKRLSLEEKEFINMYTDRITKLDKKYLASKLREYPDRKAIKHLLVSCLELHYGSLDGCLVYHSGGEIS